jgi:sugar phosphate isomerase/epimerase
MQLKLGIKSDPIQYRYSHSWLFGLLDELDIRYVQLGSFFELYSVEDGFFKELRRQAEKKHIQIKSCFTTHRELGGFFTGNPYLERAARVNYKRYIHAASVLGADYVGSNPGTVYRDNMGYKQAGIDCYLKHMKELTVIAKAAGLKGLTIEPMSSSIEPPSTPEEYDYMLGELSRYYQAHSDSAVPVYLCGDISHGVADESGRVVHGNMELFEHGIPNMAEFHFKNTDPLFNSTFGFSPEERERGIVDVDDLIAVVYRRAADWPVEEVVGYYETGGPKMGRDYSDPLLRDELTESLLYLKDRIEVHEASRERDNSSSNIKR